MYHYKPSFMSGVISGNELFFSDSFINALCVADISTGLCTYIDRFPDEKEEVRLLHSGAFKYKDSIIFAPYKGEHIHYLDLISKELKSIELHVELGKEGPFIFSLLLGDELWLFPQYIDHHVISYDLLTGEIFLHDDFQSKCSFEKEVSRVLSYSYSGNKVYAFVSGTSMLIEFDLISEEFITLVTQIEKIFNVYAWKDERWICTEDGIYKLQNGTQNYEKYDTADSIVGSVLFKDENSKDIYAMSAVGGPLYILKGSSFVKCEQIDIERSPTYTTGYMYEKYACTNKGILVFPPYGKDGLLIKDGNIIIKGFHVKNEKDITIDGKDDLLIHDNEPIYESGPISIYDYISLVCNKK